MALVIVFAILVAIVGLADRHALWQPGLVACQVFTGLRIAAHVMGGPSNYRLAHRDKRSSMPMTLVACIEGLLGPGIARWHSPLIGYYSTDSDVFCHGVIRRQTAVFRPKPGLPVLIRT